MKKAGRLQGKTVLVTRSEEQAKTLTSLLRKEGARVLQAPTIKIVLRDEEIQKLEQAIQSLDAYSWLVLTSTNTVAILDSLIRKLNQDWHAFDALQIACIGTSTAERVQQLGGKVALIPPSFQAESLAHQMLKAGVSGTRILLPRAVESRQVLPEILSANGAIVDEIQVYKAEIPESSRSKLIRLLQQEKIDFITFTSSSTVRNFIEMTAEIPGMIDGQKTLVACIGPITAATLREYDIPVRIQAAEFTISGLVSAIVEHVESAK
jgi:uroporphyrinogen III methyltransferase/synthase